MALAKVNGLFRQVRDVELRYSSSGSEIVKMGLVCSEKYQDKENTLFIDAVAFGKSGKAIYDYAGQKGNQIYIAGKLQTEQWQDQQGQNRSKISMVVESFEFVSGNKQCNQNQQSNNYQPQQHQHQQPAQNIPEVDIDDEDIPF